ncbi:aldehyde dehydrogenase family protein [Rhodococcus opacus]|uniref:aldehyde dehydrogenase family protein n=1 Tax=Rhodococcus opacus TaxID=37919 RepID=UPI001FEDE92B|nr:aldehyde dehydrogenase family protein [Rhodococcus opacus]
MTDVDLTATCLIGGRWVPGSGVDAIEVFNPATGRVITELVPASIEDAEAAVVAASRAFADWGSRLTDKRIQLFPDPVESGCIHARMLSRRPRKLEPTRRANKVLLAVSTGCGRSRAAFLYNLNTSMGQ